MTREREARDPDSKYTLGKGLKYALRPTIKNPETGRHELSYIGKANRNAKKLGITESKVKSLMKLMILDSPTMVDNYNIYRSEGMGRYRSYVNATLDEQRNLLTLGKHNYDRQENRGLEHSIY